MNEEVSIIYCLFVNPSWITNTLSGAWYESDEDVHVNDGKDPAGAGYLSDVWMQFRFLNSVFQELCESLFLSVVIRWL